MLVNRGWVAGNADRSRLPEVRTPADTVEITGLAVVPGRRFLELSDQRRGRQGLAEPDAGALPAGGADRAPAGDDPAGKRARRRSRARVGSARTSASTSTTVTPSSGSRSARPILVFYLVTHVRRGPDAFRRVAQWMSGSPRRSRTSCGSSSRIAAAPVAASYLLYYFWPPAHTVNYGELIEPRPLPDPALTLADGAPFRLSQLKGKWVLVSVDAGRLRRRLREKARLHAPAAAHPGQGHGARGAGVARER